MTISIPQKFGPICMDPDAGALLCEEISQFLNHGEHVQVDFAGVSLVTSSFLNPAIGSLYGKFPKELIDGKLTIVGLDDVDRDLLSDVQDNAVRFFAESPEQQDRLACISPC